MSVYHDQNSILIRARELIGKPMRIIDKKGLLSTGKGAIGNLIQENWFGIAVNNTPAPDFPEAGVELKVTPFVVRLKQKRAKERLVCNMIDYCNEYRLVFETSSFWKKCKTMLILTYHHNNALQKSDFLIDDAFIYQFPDIDLAIIKKDWEKIVNAIRRGKAHEISEADTLYLGACTKARDSKVLRKQPFSIIKAKPRAFALKQSYVSQILTDYVYSGKSNPYVIRTFERFTDDNRLDMHEHVIKDLEAFSNVGFEGYIKTLVQPHLGKSIDELKSEFSIDSDSKQINNLIFARILGLHGRLADADELRKAGIVPKTIRRSKNGNIKESMSFPASLFDPFAIVSQSWEDSALYDYFETRKFLFVVFQETIDKTILENVALWNMPQADMDELKKVWEATRKALIEGVKTWVTGKITRNNLPSSSENPVSHVRPHGTNRKDVVLLPDGQYITKQSFWLNNHYIKNQLEALKHTDNP